MKCEWDVAVVAADADQERDAVQTKNPAKDKSSPSEGCIMIEPNQEQNLACQINTLNSVQQAKHQALIKQILSTKHEVKEIPAGYEINFPYNTSLFLEISEWINLQVEEGQLQLSITGKRSGKAIPTRAGPVTRIVCIPFLP
ncbi:MAG TPA: hypothetical protein VFE98_04975 [Candidatus Bathyarchaeia archaeon]|nr:hypothetical protein [Candidatus Bathyarchaeia archaeon]